MPDQSGQAYGEQLTFYADWQKQEKRRTGLNVQYVSSRKGELALAFEIAPIAHTGQPPDWSRKITVHLSGEELVELCAVLLGCQEELQAMYHGDAHNKGMQVRAKPGVGAWLGLSQAGANLQFVLSPAQRMSLSAFSLRRLAQAWQVPVQAAIEIIRAC